MSNIVTAVFGGSKTTRTRRLWKIDKGMLLQFVGLNLPTAYQVHFANTPSSGLAKVVTATSDTVEIPYEYLQTGADVYAWIYLTPENGVGYTEYMVTIPVYARPDTTDEEPTPAQQSALDTAISALNSGVESVQAAVAGVQDSIDTALQEAKDSGEFDGADGYTPVKGVDYFDGEKGDTGATGETGNGIASAVLNADYTLTLTYTDGTTWTSGSIRGERGDKGDTGADGYSPVATVTQTETGATVTVTDKSGTTTAEISNGQDGTTFTPAVSAEGVISWTNDGGKTNPQPMNIKGPQGDDYILTATDKEEIAQQAAASLAPVLDEKAPVIYCEASGAIASFTDGADNLPVQDLVVQIEPVQAGSGDPSPDNVRPITGWTGVNLTVSPTTDAEDGQTYTISFGSAGTVYGGSLDVTTGVLTVDRAMVDIGTLNWTYISGSSFNMRSSTNIGALPPKTISSTPNAISSIYPVLSYLDVSQTDKSLAVVFATSPQAGAVWVHDSSYSDVDTFKAAMSGAQLVYELATPQTYQLTPTEIRTLLGQNNIWADTGDTTVTYCADTKLYIQQLTKPTAADVGAIAAPASPATGAFLVWSGNAWTAQTLATWEGGSF